MDSGGLGCRYDSVTVCSRRLDRFPRPKLITEGHAVDHQRLPPRRRHWPLGSVTADRLPCEPRRPAAVLGKSEEQSWPLHSLSSAPSWADGCWFRIPRLGLGPPVGHAPDHHYRHGGTSHGNCRSTQPPGNRRTRRTQHSCGLPIRRFSTLSTSHHGFGYSIVLRAAETESPQPDRKSKDCGLTRGEQQRVLATQLSGSVYPLSQFARKHRSVLPE